MCSGGIERGQWHEMFNAQGFQKFGFGKRFMN